MASTQPSGAGTGTTPAVLLADDRPDKLAALAAVLMRIDVDLVIAASGKEALRHLLVLTSMPVLILSTSNHPVDRSRCLAAGASDYLVKPPRFEDLMALVEMVATRYLKQAS